MVHDPSRTSYGDRDVHRLEFTPATPSSGTVEALADAERALRRLRDREAELSSIVAAIPDILVVTDLDGRILEFHNGDDRHTLRTEDFVGRHICELSPPGVCARTLELTRLAVTSRRVQEHRYSITHEGRVGHYVSRGMAFGEPPKILWHTRDVTEEARLQKRLLEAQRLEGLAVVASAVAHDFSNLLTGILGNAELARLELGPAMASTDALDEIVVASRRAFELCHQLRGLNGTGRLSLELLDLSALADEMIGLMHVRLGERIVVVRELPLSPALPMVVGDASQLRQVLLCLLSNASESMSDSGGTITVRTGRAPRGESWDGRDELMLEVEDTGCGMDERTRSRVFEPYFSTKVDGRGLGLSACLGIVRSHGGRMEVDSSPGVGSRFRVLLPLDEDPATPSEQLGPMPLAGSGLVVVITSDERLVGQCRRLLGGGGYRVQHIPRGDEALIAVRAAAPLVRAMVLDLELNGGLGPGLLAEIRAIAPATALLGVGQAGDAPSRGERLLERPFSPVDLARALTSLLDAVSP